MNQDLNNETNTTPVVETPEVPTAEPTTPVAPAPVQPEVPTQNVVVNTPEVAPAPAEPKGKGSKAFIIAIIAVLLIIACVVVGMYIKGELEDRELENAPEEELPTEVITESRDIDKEETYTINYDGNDIDLVFQFYYEKNDKIPTYNDATGEVVETEGYDYRLEILDQPAGYGDYLIGQGKTKEEAKASTLVGTRPTYNADMIKVIKDTATGKDNLLFIIPEYVNTGYKGNFVAVPTFFYIDGNSFKELETSYTYEGFAIAEDTTLGLTADLVKSTHATIRVDGNTIYYIEKEECTDNGGVVTIKKLIIQNGEVIITNASENLKSTGEGASC